ncbi:hypothetical protein TRIUR3_19745 [Triticum urartu]|uniref:Uncharacterized protein n=1 Tax=Triticum urartu TaxID=4572 RepID=M7Z5H3_TRIUA|nr:hypothetical protein TRIUR3_19745 [Triticum urartu]
MACRLLVLAAVMVVRWVNKMGRAAGVLENHEEGRRYAEHGLRAYVQDKTPEIMPGINKFFTSPK